MLCAAFQLSAVKSAKKNAQVHDGQEQHTTIN